MNNKFKPLDDNSEHKYTVMSFFQAIFKISEFVSFANIIFVDKGLPELSSQLNSQGKGKFPVNLRDPTNAWLNDGIACEILKPGGIGRKEK